MPILTRGPRDIPALDRWFVLDLDRVRSMPTVNEVKVAFPHDRAADVFVHWSLLTDDERNLIWEHAHA